MARQFPGLIFSRRYFELTSSRPSQSGDQLFDAAYAGMITTSETAHSRLDDHPLRLDISRWAGPADEIDMLVVARCEPPVIDLGCGPGRMVQALAESGRAADELERLDLLLAKLLDPVELLLEFGLSREVPRHVLGFCPTRLNKCIDCDNTAR